MSVTFEKLTKFYLLAQASELVEDIDLRIALLCKSITVERNEEFVESCRLGLAAALIEKGLYSFARHELNKYSSFYQSKSWGIKQDYRDIDRQIPFQVTAEDTKPLFDTLIPQAGEFIYSAIPSQFAIKIDDRQIDDKKHPGRRFTQWTLRTKDTTLRLVKPGKFGLENRARNGAPFDIKLHDGKIVWIQPSTRSPLQQDWIKKIEGAVKLRTDRKGNPFTIIGDAFVGHKLLLNIRDNQRVKIIALRQDDARWAAISLAPI